MPSILNEPKRRRKFRQYVNWQPVDDYRRLGGVRIEDTVLVTSNEPVVLTAAVGHD